MFEEECGAQKARTSQKLGPIRTAQNIHSGRCEKASHFDSFRKRGILIVDTHLFMEKSIHRDDKKFSVLFIKNRDRTEPYNEDSRLRKLHGECQERAGKHGLTHCTPVERQPA